MNSFKRLIPFAIGVLLLSIPIYLLYLWFYACSQTEGLPYPHARDLYNSYLPQFLKARYAGNLFSLPFCAIAIILNIRNTNSQIKWLKAISLVVVAVGGLVGFANLWSMM
jgi:hypothetical protein